MATYHCQIKTGNKGSGACASAKADYVCREGKYVGKGDIEGTPWHGNMPSFAQANPGEFWQAADLNERANGRVYTEIEIALPRDYSAEERRKMVEGFIAEQLPNNPYTVAIHCPKAAIEGGDQPHAHIVFSERIMDGIDRPADQFFKRAAAPYRDRVTKEMVDPDDVAKAKGGTKKDLSWHSRDKIIEVRETWERHHNRAVFDVDQVSCKSLKDQGIDREPERHLGYALSKSAAADHVVDRRTDRQRSTEIDREIARATKVEATRKEQERQQPKPVPQVQPAKPIIVPPQPTAVTAVAPQLRKSEPVIQEPVSPPKPLVTGIHPAQSEALPPVKETNLPIQQPAFEPAVEAVKPVASKPEAVEPVVEAVPLWRQDSKPFEWGKEAYKQAEESVIAERFDKPWQDKKVHLEGLLGRWKAATQQSKEAYEAIKAKTFKMPGTEAKAKDAYEKNRNETWKVENAYNGKADGRMYAAARSNWIIEHRQEIMTEAEKRMTPEANKARSTYKQIETAKYDHQREQQAIEREKKKALEPEIDRGRSR